MAAKSSQHYANAISHVLMAFGHAVWGQERNDAQEHAEPEQQLEQYGQLAGYGPQAPPRQAGARGGCGGCLGRRLSYMPRKARRR
jgi:hypothetical protein